jgi:GAF domain-containing protein
MDLKKKAARYVRIYEQLEQLLSVDTYHISRMATIAAVLHHKMDYFFWTGFYLLRERELRVGPYQGPVACMVLEKDKGVCWAGISRKETIVVPDVHQFPGHIACDSRSNSEIVVPLFDSHGEVYGVLDVDSRHLASFDAVDAEWLRKIVALI